MNAISPIGGYNMGPGPDLLQPWSAKQLADNDTASLLIRKKYAQRFNQLIYSTSFVPIYGQSTVINVPIQPVGLITKFTVLATVTVTNPNAGSTITRGSFGPFNMWSLISYMDPNQNTRVLTNGLHIASIAARRHRRVPGAAVTTDSPTGFGATMAPIAAPATIANNTAGTVSGVWEIPLAVGRDSLKGGVFAGTIFSNQQLQLTFNPNFAQNSADGLQACYTGASNANPPTYAVTMQVFQEYWDQFPLQLLTPLSPDLSTTYELKFTAFTPLIASTDNYIRFNNLRSFLSTLLLFDNGGTLNPGTDINYFMLQAANQTTLWKRSALLHSYMTRNHFGDDWPAAGYMFDFSESPIITAAEGNTVLAVNPSTVNANAVIYVGWEDLAVSSVLASASSLAGTAGLG